MDTKQLITFKTAADLLNFTHTAKILNFAQSSVTGQIKSLEAELGTPLFERLGKRLILTESGKQFKQYAEKMIMISEESKQVVKGGEEPTGTLTIGAQESQCTYRIPLLLKQFKNQFPKVKIVFKQSYSNEQAREQLLEGKLDIAFIMDKIRPVDSLHIETLIQEELKVVVASDYPLPKENYLFPLHYENETFLLTEKGCSYRTILEESFHTATLSILNKFEFVSIEAIKQCVNEGLGIAVLPAMVVEKEIKEGKMQEIAWMSLESTIHTQIAWHKDKWVTSPLRAFIELTRNTFIEFQNNTR
ncbi:DNA-binding transcriptional LysR family regulator [Metabacillus crassostreae]|uniref:LysR family transcriptional regulator n=1 Tax=Metabacillus crassostreae TaxID=929098 RepID=UPI001959B5D2|nr:LysR family transcriptional regulator [Metabacillus crassostreae]MBM7602739.1 DNA-binding transcriptional LysR family regulator [Metabacillus crassostreae]